MWLAMAVAVLAAIVLASALHGTLVGKESDDTGTSPVQQSPEVAGEHDLPDPAGTQAPPAGDVLAGGQVTWIASCGVELPVSARYGPRHRDGGRAAGFAREPGGAVLAALHLVVRVSPQTGPYVFIPTVQEQVTGPDTGRFAYEIHTQYEQLHTAAGVPYGQPLCPIYGRLAGFVLDSYHDRAASLRLLIEAPGPQGAPQLAAVLVQVSWVDGDWRLVAPPRGDWSTVRTLLPATAVDQYTPLAPGR
jgi:hypothetical protein